MTTYNTVLFDWDGNLAMTLHVWLEATRVPFENRGITITDRQLTMDIFGRVVEGFAEYGITDIDAAIKEMDDTAKRLLPQVDLYPDALYVLGEIKKKGRRTALITTSLRENVLHLLDKYNIHNFFDVVIAHEDTTKHKPHAEPLEKALQLLGASKNDAVMIGDSINDIDAANNAGVASILFFPDSHEVFYDLTELQNHKPTYTVTDFKQVLEIIE